MEIKIQGQFHENELEDAIIELFKEQDYEYLCGDNMSRRYEDVLIEDDLRSFLLQKYEADNLSDIEIQKIINKLSLISAMPLYQGNKETFMLINEGFDLMRDDTTKIAVHINYIDFDEPCNNRFKVVNQFSMQGTRLRRPDLLVFVNGIPVAICEFKSAIKEDTTIHDAWKQITVRYSRDIPKLMKYCFLSVISDGVNTKIGSIFTPYPFYYSWNKANEVDKVANGISSLITMIKGAFAKDRLIGVLRDFIFYPDSSDKQEAIVCRYPQYFAANKMLANIKEHMRPLGDGKGGTYFGATGCGKTYTMLFLARMLALRDNETFKNPTVIIITDREDLNNQASKLFVTATRFLREEGVKSIESREDLGQTLRDKPSGGVYITNIQKFCESTGVLSQRANIICISDEAHRSQTNVGEKIKKTDEGVFTTYGFAGYLKKSLPNATYCGVTGTPIDETIAVFGDIVDRYTMKESSDDGITLRIAYEPRLAKVVLEDDQLALINKYYNKCTTDGANEEQVEESKRAMSKLSAVLGHKDVVAKIAKDMVEHYENMCSEKPKIVQKAMIVCADRVLAYKILTAMTVLRPNWGTYIKSENESELTKQELDALKPLPKINIVATQGVDDEKSLFDACGTKEHRKMLDTQFKDDNSNFKIAIVVDMWITGFDVPSLAVMYINKPLKKHTLIQTISRVNRVFEGKDKGLVVDYIGIKKDMFEAIKKYGTLQESPIDEMDVALGIFRNHLALITALISGFNAHKYYNGTPLERLHCLNLAAEYIQLNKENQTRFMGLARRLKGSYVICFPTGDLTDEETVMAQFYLAIRSIIYKQTKGNAPDAATMNSVVEEMVKSALTCNSVENIFDDNETIDIFSDATLAQLDKVKLPVTKLNALLKLLKKAINDYGKTNKVKAIDFSARLSTVVDKYNTRDNIEQVSEIVFDFITSLTDEILDIFKDLKEDKSSFEKLGITFEEKAFYDILVKVRDDHDFDFAEDKCLDLAKKIKDLVDDKSKFADWSTKFDIKNALNMELTLLLYRGGYPPEWDEEVFEKVLDQAENFKKYC